MIVIIAVEMVHALDLAISVIDITIVGMDLTKLTAVSDTFSSYVSI